MVAIGTAFYRGAASAPKMPDERRSSCELSCEEAPQEDAQAQAPQDAQEDALAAQAQVVAPLLDDSQIATRALAPCGALCVALTLLHCGDDGAQAFATMNHAWCISRLSYHLGPAGLGTRSPRPSTPLEHGLREVKDAIRHTTLNAAGSASSSSMTGSTRACMSAIKGCVTEFRVYHMREGAPSTVERWTTRRDRCSPNSADPEAALDLAESMMMLQRRIERAVKAAGSAVSSLSSSPREARHRPLPPPGARLLQSLI